MRSSKTRGGQVYHTDNSFNLPPEHVALLCLQPAMQGGESGLISFDSVYNRLVEKYPDILPRLAQPFYFDRQREHADSEPLHSSYPVFEMGDGTLRVRLATNIIRQGYVVADRDPDTQTLEALESLDQVMSSEDLAKTFDFAPGQVQVINNRRIGHRRTGFVDWPQPERKRHLVRLWLRDFGRSAYPG